VSWDTSVDTSTPLTVDLESGNDFYMNYYADQFEDGWPGGYCWDAYQASYFDGFIDESGGADYSLPGPPGEGVAETYIPVYEFAGRFLAISRAAPPHSRASTAAVRRKVCRLGPR
jgi:hypothetical protein